MKKCGEKNKSYLSASFIDIPIYVAVVRLGLGSKVHHALLPAPEVAVRNEVAAGILIFFVFQASTVYCLRTVFFKIHN